MRDILILLLRAGNFDLSGEILQQLTSIAMMEYLHLWLELDPNAQGTLYNFSKYGYYSKADREKDPEKEYVSLDEESRNLYFRRLQIAAQKVTWNMQERKWQDKRQGQHFKKLRQTYAYPTLCLISQSESPSDPYTPYGMWPLFYLAFFRGGYMKETTKKETVSGSLPQAYKCYLAYMKNLDTIESDREYVINCMSMKKLEQRYRWSFMANLAYYMKEIDIHPETVPILLTAYITRLPPKLGPVDIPELHSINTSFKESLFMHDYAELIDDVYSSLYNSQEYQVIRCCQILQIRYILDNAIKLLKQAYPISEMPSWTDADYSNVRVFIKEYYRIDTFTNSLDFIENLPENDRFYDILRQLYNSSWCFDQNLQKALQKRKNIPKSKKRKLHIRRENNSTFGEQ